MLKMIHGKAGEDHLSASSTEKMVRIKEAAWPAPFVPGLEYNSPAHGTWNIVHTGMLIPGAHQIYVCAANCNRGVVLTAAEMNAADRFSTIALCEEDITGGGMEELVIDGVTEILRKLKRKPSVILLFTVCLHHFMGCDLDYIYHTLRERFPTQRFVDCYMDPIMQKGGLTPDQKLRIGMYTCLEEREKNPKQINIIGNDLPLQPEAELLTMLRSAGYTIKDITTCQSFDEYLSMGESVCNLSMYPSAKIGAEKLSARLHMTHFYLPQTFSYEEIDRQLHQLAEHFSCVMPDTEMLRRKCEEECEKTRELLGDTPIVLDAAAVPRYLGLARFLLEHGFPVQRIYGDSFSAEEKADYQWLKKNAPDLEVCATIHAAMRVFPRTQQEVLAIGQKAAYFHQTGHFVNMVEGGGLFGYAGIYRLLQEMQEAYRGKKETKRLIIQKGLGCESCI